MRSNAVVALGGGPSPVINASLLGVFDRCRNYDMHINRVLGARHGVEGILKEELVDLSGQDYREMSLLKNTPGSGAIGTCRYKLDESCGEDFERILEVFSSHDTGYFFYIGGNDSMDTADKVSELAKNKNMELTVAGIPKTIDNDLGDEKFEIIDHTPGYGSAARYWANIIQNINEENSGMCVSECVSVIQAMGRKSGFITAAARLADPERKMPLQMYFAESGLNLEILTDNVNRELKKSGRCIVVVNEGFDAGPIGEEKDGFGHIEYGASRSTVAQAVVNHLNNSGLAARGYATGQVPGVLQRITSAHRSVVDVREAYEAGAYAVDMAIKKGSGFMATILRASGRKYRAEYSSVSLKAVANSQRFLPSSWICREGTDVTDDFIRYALPLIGNEWPEIPLEGGLQRFARLNTDTIGKKLKKYVPVKIRS